MPNCAPAYGAFGFTLLSLDRLGIDFDFDLVAHHRGPRFGTRVIADPKLLAAQLRFSIKANPRSAPGISNWAAEFNRKCYFLGDSVHGEVSRHDIFITLFLNLFAGERNRRIFLSIKEIGGLQMSIPFGYAGVDAFDLNRALGFLNGITVHNDRRAKLIELPMNFVDYEMADGKCHGGMVRIDVERVGRERSTGEYRSK